MSLDYPFYEELCRRKHRAARWWIIGDRLYYLGLIPACLAFSGAVPAVFVGLFGPGWRLFWICAVAFVLGVIVNWLGMTFKRRAYHLAERDGITAAEVWNKTTTEKTDGP